MSDQVIERKLNGQFAKGVSGNLGGNAQRSRHALNADTIREMHLAFRRGGRKAIDKVMKTQPAAFLKLLVLLVPRELKVEHTGGVKAMSDEQLEAGIEAIQAMLAARDAGSSAKLIEANASVPTLSVAAIPQDSEDSKPRRTRRKAARTMGSDMGSAPDATD
jgi:hypothetical protein